MILVFAGSYVCHRVAVDPHCVERSVQNVPQHWFALSKVSQCRISPQLKEHSL